MAWAGPSQRSESKTQAISADEFRKAVVGQAFGPKQKFYDKYGPPLRISDVGKDTYLYYKCKDGDVVVKCRRTTFEKQDVIAPFAVDRQ